MLDTLHKGYTEDDDNDNNNNNNNNNNCDDNNNKNKKKKKCIAVIISQDGIASIYQRLSLTKEPCKVLADLPFFKNNVGPKN